MTSYSIRSSHNNQVLFTGHFLSFKSCLECAVTDKADLSHADLKNLNLAGANLDEALLDHADFSGSNLTGANISEASLNGARFGNAALYNTCLAYARLRGCDFEYGQFGATDITGADISCSRFAGLSCLSLNFVSAETIEGCAFKFPDGTVLPMSRPPVVINGLSALPIIMFGNYITTGLASAGMHLVG